jgi:lysophospholipase L1-like esterase
MRTTGFVIVALLLAIAAAGPAWSQGRVTEGQQVLYGLVRVMPCGDSITRGAWGATDDAGYRRSLFLQLTAAGHTIEFVGTQATGVPVDFDRNHEGYDGWRADQIRDNIYNWLTLNPAEIVLLHIGTNDISGGNQNAQEVADILNNIDRWEADNAAPITVVLARIIQRIDSLNPQTIAFNDAVEAMALARIAGGDDIILVDQENALTYPGDMADSVHPNDAGYGKMADTWFATLNAILPVSGVSTVSNVTLAASSPGQLTTDDLTCTYNLNGDAVTAATAWTRNGVPEMALYLPMEGAEPTALLDHSGHGLVVGKVDNPVWTYGAGHDGYGAYVFDGSDGLNAGENFPINSSYTKCAWVYRTGSGANGGNNIISGDQNEGGHAFWAPDHKSNHLSAGHTGSAWLGVEDSVPLALNTWYFVAVTWDDASDLMILYKDGVEVDRATVTPSVTDPSLYVGTFGTSGWRWLGTIDDPRVYAHALPPEQIAALFTTGRDVIVSQETAIGDQWQAQVTPFSATEAGATVPSNTLTILPGGITAVENLALVSESGNDLPTDDLTCTYDLAGDAVTAATAWKRGGVPEMSVYLPMEGGATNALRDYSGSGNHGSPVGDPNWVATGGPDAHGCFEFDGNDHIGLGSPMPSGGAYTKAVWIYWTPGAFMNNMISGNSGHALWVTSYPEGNASSPLTAYYLSAGHSNPWRAVKDATSFPANQWVHTAVSYDPAVGGGTMILYRDGAEVARATGIAPSTDRQAFLGAFAAQYQIKGSLDDARIYLHALSAAQVASLYSAGRDVIVDEETNVGDEWQAFVTAFSTTDAGDLQASNVLTVAGGPTLTNVALTSTSGRNVTSDDLTASYTLAGSATTAATAWTRNGAPIMNLYYPFEGGSGRALTDYSGGGHQGIPGSDPAWVADGGHDGHGGLVLDGNDYIDAGQCMSTGAYTKSAWVYWINNAATMNNILSGQNDHAFWIANHNGGERLTAGHHGAWFTVADPVLFVPQVWTFVAVTYDPAVAGGTLTLYKNGASVATATGVTPTTDTRAYVGAYAGNYIMQGSIDDVRIHNRALSADQIQALYTGENVIVAAETGVGDVWQARVTPFSAEAAGPTIASNSVTIIDPPSGVDEPVRPTGYALHGNVPNPFNPLTVIAYEMPVAAQVSLRVFDISGRLIATLKEGVSESAGRHDVTWTGRDHSGRQVAAGIYFYRMEAGSFAQTRRMVLVK